MAQTFADVIDQFGGPAAFARDVGISPGAAKQAKRRKSLHPRWFSPTVRAAKAKGLAITEKTLAEIAEATGA